MSVPKPGIEIWK